jgi:hypothetical protein
MEDNPFKLASTVGGHLNLPPLLGGACISATVIKRSQEVAGDGETCSSSGSTTEDSVIATTWVKSTTACHADHFLNNDGSFSYREPVTDHVGFIMLDNNPGAFFACGDDRVQVPFPGNVKQNTVVKSGTICLLAGPFHVSSLAFLGNGCNTKANCNKGHKCNCNAGKVRALENIQTLKSATSATSCGGNSGGCMTKRVGGKKKKLLV